MSIEYVVGRDYKDACGRKWKLIYLAKKGSRVFVDANTDDNITWGQNIIIVSEWPRTVTLNGEDVELEPWATCVAMDGDGAWYQYEKPPLRGKGGF